jgi:hypothetical protein
MLPAPKKYLYGSVCIGNTTRIRCKLRSPHGWLIESAVKVNDSATGGVDICCVALGRPQRTRYMDLEQIRIRQNRLQALFYSLGTDTQRYMAG